MRTRASPNRPDGIALHCGNLLGPVLEQADEDGFDDPADVRLQRARFIPSRKRSEAFIRTQHSLRKSEASSGGIRAGIPRVGTGRDHAAYPAERREWMLKAGFSMRWGRGFEIRYLGHETRPTMIQYEASRRRYHWD